ncbi:MAG: GAF and ANTAR domain-containing protein [Streptosporangiaceae bacterium]|nr:GAF and ANTAR domain-containing protein [Streptosporangiaceae bacterium]MBV9857585.1 GAF and ANTAR domain-containing protein [Streptosporangiaceae bacterium]
MTEELLVNGKIRKAFVGLADTLVDDFDIIDFLDMLCQCTIDLLGVTACGILLADHAGKLNLTTASTERARGVELLQLEHAQGPCLDAYRARAALSCPDLAAVGGGWPKFARGALRAGFAAVHALPMHLRDETVGVLNLYRDTPGTLDAGTAELGQALADVATIGILHQRAVRQQEILTGQLQTALNSRVTIEQAKGVLAERMQVTIDEAFAVLRAYARDHNLRLAAVARSVTEGTVDIRAAGAA